MLSAACALCVLSEVVKVFSVIRLVPSSDGSTLYPYLELQQLPLHLCSLQIFFLFYARFAKEGSSRTAVLAFLYPTCLIGICALFIPTVFSNIESAQAFTHPLGYQYFLYHAMLAVVGLSIPLSRQVPIQRKHYFTTMGILGALAFLSLYLNSIFASPIYEDGELVGVERTTNFFFTYAPPVDLPITQPWQWFLYLGGLVLLVAVGVALLYLPFFRKKGDGAEGRAKTL